MILKIIREYKRILLLPVILLCFSASPLLAQSTLSIGVAPTSKILKLVPGESYEGEVVFWNMSQNSDNYQIMVKPFRQIENQPGTAIVLTEEEEKGYNFSAAKWITVTPQGLVKLESNKNTKLKYIINVPPDATNGEYTAEIFLISQSDAQRKGTAAFTNLGSGMPILIQIGDEFVENAELLTFTTEKKWYEKTSVNFYTTIKNIGDTHITPSGEIIITNIFRQEVARIQFNRNTQSLLRENTGNYIDNWTQSGYLSPNKAIALGPLKAKLLVTYRSIQPGFAVLTEDVTFWIIPWKIIVAILVVALAGIIYSISRKKLQNRK
ncbi:hypothetical protein A3K02_00620 [candidate division WS6 bacterium RIFOXYD1_FULL_33_8]|nr:MAG: hypothetical protein A2369_01740 [candidate division WS6 bacterium RIFOXYB1_FULL_33_15]OGC42841.1 MAG: hypothetical protein A3K02_00620 [candidate division WS6 bacterium RIFOXYD1_FULL_33_8]